MYSKLVRDIIPEIMRQEGKNPQFHTADEKEYREKLMEKLQEECDEFKASQKLEELADILEVVYALAAVQGCNVGQLEMMRKQKAAKRGGFKKKLILK
ncbi:nucleoside triphosphate pyrophosphohydrolase [Candidatus Roizmanbacteria bacterium]|nr:nucleoside triphosphate pyrophosphohydrolase [Candidatus Roizmanbacteria bacterium]